MQCLNCLKCFKNRYNVTEDDNGSSNKESVSNVIHEQPQKKKR